MAHERTLIRDAIAAALMNKTSASERVVASPRRAWAPRDLPAIGIYPRPERIVGTNQINAPERRLLVSLNLLAPAGDVPDEAMDAFILEVETALFADPFLGNLDCLTRQIQPSQEQSEDLAWITDPVVTSDGERSFTVVSMTIEVQYRVQFPREQGGNVTDLVSIHADTDIDGSGDATGAQDVLDNLNV